MYLYKSLAHEAESVWRSLAVGSSELKHRIAISFSNSLLGALEREETDRRRPLLVHVQSKDTRQSPEAQNPGSTRDWIEHRLSFKTKESLTDGATRNLGDTRVKQVNNQGTHAAGPHSITVPKARILERKQGVVTTGWWRETKRYLFSSRYRIAVWGGECSVDGQWVVAPPWETACAISRTLERLRMVELGGAQRQSACLA